jgi:AcrR family transcriptional regulator
MGTRQRREREKEERRKAILDAARSLFWKKGYDGTTIPDIARAVELAQGTLYLYFPNKDSLYVELLLEGYESLEERLAAVINRRKSPKNQGAALVDEFIAFAKDSPQYFDIIFFVIQRERTEGWLDTFDADQIARLEARLDACKAIAGQALQRLVPDATEAELATTVDAVWSMLAGLVFFFRRKRNPALFDTVAAQARRLILEGLST